MGNKFGSFVKGFAGGIGLGLTWKKAQAEEERAKSEEERKKRQDERDATTFDRNTEEYERTKRAREETETARAKIAASLLNIRPAEQNSSPAAGLKMPTTQQLSGQAAPAAGIDQGNGAVAYPMADRTAAAPASPVAAGLAPEKKPASKTINIGEEIDSMNSGIYTLIKNGTISPEEIGRYQRLPLMLQNEGIMEAAKYLKAGQPEMAEKALNSVGDFKGNKLVSIKKGVVNKYGVKNDTTIATFKMPDGRNFVIDTALIDMGAIGTEKNIELMQKAVTQADTRASNAETGRHNRATEATAEKKATEGGSQPAAVQTVKYLLDSGIAKTPADAWRMNKTLNEKSPEAAAMEIAAGLVKNYMEPEEAAKIARELVKQFYGQQDAPQATDAPQPAPAPGGAPPAAGKPDYRSLWGG